MPAAQSPGSESLPAATAATARKLQKTNSHEDEVDLICASTTAAFEKNKISSEDPYLGDDVTNLSF